MTDTLSGIESWISQVGATLQSLPTALEQAAPTGGFAAVLSSVQGMLEGSSAASGASASGSSSASGASPSGADVVAEAENYLGVPYQWGGSTPTGFDCSGLVQYVYAQLGVSLPRTSEEQATAGTPVASLADAQPGDLVFFAGSDGTASSPGHVGIYVGNGQMIDAPYTGAAVRIEPVGNPLAIRRVLPSPTDEATNDSSSSASLMASMDAPGALSPTSGGASGASSALSGVPAALAPLFVAAAGNYDLPATLLVAVARQESNFNTEAVSGAGAEGLMQLMPQTAAALGVDPMDPAQAVNGAAQILSGYLRQYGSVPLALAAYNAGPGAVAEYGGVPPYPETEQYVSSIMASLGGTT